MSLTEQERHDAFEALSRTFGDHTEAVIRMLKADHDHLATKADLDESVADLGRRIDALAARMDALDARVDTRFALLQVSFKDEIHAAFGAQTRTMMTSLISALVLIVVTNSLAIFAG